MRQEQQGAGRAIQLRDPNGYRVEVIARTAGHDAAADPHATGARATLDRCPYLGLHRPGDPEGMGILSYGNLRYTEITPAMYQGSNPNGD